MPACAVPERIAGEGRASHLAQVSTWFSSQWRAGLDWSSERPTPALVRLFVEPQGVGLLHVDRVVLK